MLPRMTPDRAAYALVTLCGVAVLYDRTLAWPVVGALALVVGRYMEAEWLRGRR